LDFRITFSSLRFRFTCPHFATFLSASKDNYHAAEKKDIQLFYNPRRSKFSSRRKGICIKATRRFQGQGGVFRVS
jgi:hypothetical protein